MQENRRNFSIFKTRIIEYLEMNGISRYECYQKTGMSRSVLSQSNGMTEDNLLKFLAVYKDISLEWLIFGEGEVKKIVNEDLSNNSAKIVIEMELSSDDLLKLNLKKQIKKVI